MVQVNISKVFFFFTSNFSTLINPMLKKPQKELIKQEVILVHPSMMCVWDLAQRPKDFLKVLTQLKLPSRPNAKESPNPWSRSVTNNPCKFDLCWRRGFVCNLPPHHFGTITTTITIIKAAHRSWLARPFAKSIIRLFCWLRCCCWKSNYERWNTAFNEIAVK